MSGDPLYYDVISCSSKDKNLINVFKNREESKIEGNEICWFTQSGRSYPQSLILKLENECRIGRIDVTAHPKYLPSSMTIAFGIPDDRFTNTIGKSYNASYKIANQFSFLNHGILEQTKSIYFDDKAVYIRFTVHGFVDSIDNPEHQIGILSIVIRGFSDKTTFSSLSDSSNSSMLNLASSLRGYEEKIDETSAAEVECPVAFRNSQLVNDIRLESDQMIRQQPSSVSHFEYDSEDEEILFTREMLKRLHKKTKECKSGRTDSAFVIDEPLLTQQSAIGKKGSSSTINTQTSEESKSEDEMQLSPRARDRILKEIHSFETELSISDDSQTSKKNSKKYFFGMRLAEYNNLARCLEIKKEEAIWEEKYTLANEIDIILEKLKKKEKPLKELLIDRMDALERNNLLEAQRLKNLFEITLHEAMDLYGLEKYLTAKEIERVRYQISKASSNSDSTNRN